MTTAPYHPSFNGLAKRAVQTLKDKLIPRWYPNMVATTLVSILHYFCTPLWVWHQLSYWWDISLDLFCRTYSSPVSVTKNKKQSAYAINFVIAKLSVCVSILLLTVCLHVISMAEKEGAPKHSSQQTITLDVVSSSKKYFTKKVEEAQPSTSQQSTSGS